MKKVVLKKEKKTLPSDKPKENENFEKLNSNPLYQLLGDRDKKIVFKLSIFIIKMNIILIHFFFKFV